MRSPLNSQLWLAVALALPPLGLAAEGEGERRSSPEQAQENRQALTLFAESFPPPPTTTCVTDQEARPTDVLLAWLERHPALWQVLIEPIETRFAHPAVEPAAQHALLDFLAHGPLPRVEDLATELWWSASERFQSDHVLAFAQKGSQLFWNELVLRVSCTADGDPRPAIVLALAGDDLGQKTLLGRLSALEDELSPGWPGSTPATLEPGALAEALLAGAALRVLGDDESWERAQALAREAALEAVTGGNLDRAKRLALETEYVTQALQSPGPLGLAHLAQKVQTHIERRLDAIVTIDDVFGLIETVVLP